MSTSFLTSRREGVKDGTNDWEIYMSSYATGTEINR